MCLAQFRAHHPIGRLRNFKKTRLTKTLSENRLFFVAVQTLGSFQFHTELMSQTVMEQQNIALTIQKITDRCVDFGDHLLKEAAEEHMLSFD